MAGEIWQLLDARGIGGIERHVTVLAQALSEAGHPCRVVLLADHGDSPFLARLRAEGVAFTVLDGRFGSLLARLKAERPRLVHTHGYKAGILGRLAARMAGIPCASTFHAGERAPFPVSVYQTLDEISSRLGTRIAVSAPIAARLPQPVSILTNFIPVPSVPPLPPNSRVVGFVGRLSPEKGPDLFCALARRVAESGKAADVSFEMFGEGPLRAELEASYGDVVHFHGLVTDPTAIWPHIGLLLMPSRAEGLPYAAIEAMAAGRPVAASALGALPELIRPGQNGWLFPTGDLDAAQAAIIAWHAGGAKDRMSWSQAAWRTARDGYGTKARLGDLLALYDRIAPV
ncbi:glycosyltransferase family 4 protein [Aquabacter sp. L1I39]|uniref:glycosyltransferase family 4 protein n=1 Tax=Aquabacter sp. L1I39 TaxID=2820278 RepID=UPI001ADA5FB9|nr:glycosyltransferase family 4 protein [Aquabacter sp. L1I39]QTL05142.1 glycosyltransferase family 4 protein [Aquabacter sp. L1I39]